MKKTMKVLKPAPVTDDMLVSSTAAEDDYPVWNAAVAYAAGGKCILNHRIYESLQAGNLNHAPETDASYWLDIGPVNRWAMFDDVVGTYTRRGGPLTVVLRPGVVSGIALMELEGRQACITMTDVPGGAVVYQRTIDLDGTPVQSFFDWFYRPYEQLTDLVLTDLPGWFPFCELTVSITATAGDVKCGVCKVGEVIDIGATEYGAGAGILDFSRKERDSFGRYSVVERSFSRRASLKVLTEKADFNRIFRTLAGLRATPCIWIGIDGPGYEPLMIYGFYRDFSIDVPYPTFHYCSLDIEGLI